jgi:hypothetical protein
LFIFFGEGVFSLFEKGFVFLFLEIDWGKLFFGFDFLVNISLFLWDELNKAPDSELIIFGVVQSTDLHSPGLKSPDDKHPAWMKGLLIDGAGDLSLCRRIARGALA